MTANVNKKTRMERTFGSKRRLAIYLTIIIVLATIGAVPQARETFRNVVFSLLPTPSPTTVYLSGDAESMGMTHGREFKYSIKLLEKIYIKLIICGNDSERLAQYSAKANKIFTLISPRWEREISGVAQASGTNPVTLMLGNTFLDIGLSSAGCRTVIVSNNNRVLHAHNLDWDNLGGIGNHLITIFRTASAKGRFATVHLGFPGLIGALDIINEKGVALSFNQVGFARNECKMPIFIKMREIAETCDDFGKAKEAIMTMPQGMPFCIALSDGKTGESAIFERNSKIEIRQRNAENGIITADNNLWYGIKMPGRCILDDIARKINPSNVENMKTVLRNKSVMLSCNIYSAIFDYKNNKLYLASGKIPAAVEQYREFPLFEQSSPEK
jgi:predicted choloylglycine hydrolase